LPPGAGGPAVTPAPAAVHDTVAPPTAPGCRHGVSASAGSDAGGWEATAPTGGMAGRPLAAPTGGCREAGLPG